MKLSLISDLHLLWNNPVCRLDDLTLTQFDKFRFVLEYCRENSLMLLQAGDFFEAPRSFIFLPKVIDLLREYEEVDIYAVFGGKRHDTYLYSDETREATNLGILEKAGLVTILEKYPVIFNENQEDQISIYGVSFGEDIPKIEEVADFNILVIHAPITDKSSWEHEIDSSDFLRENKDYDLILCGDIHKQFLNTDSFGKLRTIVNTGPLLRKTATEYEHEPCFAVFDTEDRSVKWVEIPHKPAEEVISVDHLERKEEVNDMLLEFTEQITNTNVVTVDLLDNIRKAIRKNRISNEVADIISETISRNEDK